MNKLIISGAIRKDFSIHCNSTVYTNYKIDFHKFLLKINKLHFILNSRLNKYLQRQLFKKEMSSSQY